MDQSNTQPFPIVQQHDLTLYFVRSQDGKWLRAKKHGMYGNFDAKGSWTDNINEAKIYQKPGPAKSQATFWTKNYPAFGTPEVWVVTGVIMKQYQDTSVTQKAVLRAKKKDLQREISSAQYRLDVHLADVKRLRGDGKDQKTIRLKQTVSDLKRQLKELE